MKQYLIAFLALILLLSACSQANGQILPTPSVEKTATSAHIPTSTLTPPPIPTPSPTASSAIERHCPDFMGEVSMESVSQGAILLHNSISDQIFLFDLQTGQKYPLPLEQTTPQISRISVSPNRKNYAYVTQNQPLSRAIIWVVNAKAEVLVKQTLNNHWQNMRWLDDEHLLFETKNTWQQAEVVILNLESAEFNIVAYNLPGIRTEVESGMYWNVSYSPDFQKVLYMGNLEPDTSIRPIYYDIISQQILWEAPLPISGLGYPSWSPDGKYFALMVNGDLHIIQTDGQVADILDKNQVGYISTWTYSWSPNGQSIDLWAFNDIYTDTLARLKVYDIDSKRVIDYCIDGYITATLAWSPDSTQIVVEAVDAGVILLDLPTNRYFKLLDIPDVEYPAGWMYSVSGEE